ncbi:MAG: extracellular solute-binding protein [Pseudomonadota bacterium]|nr:extracellular solute-binding protein [Pseudomonadota bacterium]
MRAVNAARSFAGSSLTIGSESGAQAQCLLRYSGPLWERLTGIRVNVVEMGLPAQNERRLRAEHEAGMANLDCASVAPAWLAGLVADGALQPLDDHVEHYMLAEDLEDYLPRYRTLGCHDGRRYGLFDDGDTLLLYYRKDLFEDDAVRAAFAARYGRPLGDPRSWSWSDLVDAARFFTVPSEARYGLAPFTQDLLWAWFQSLFTSRGGRFFDPNTMETEVGSAVGTRTMTDLLGLGAWIPPGGFAEGRPLFVVSTWLSGSAAMATFWPPLARWAEGYGPAAIGATSPSLVAGRTGYALLPGGTSHLAVGFVLSVLARSQHKEAAYLFIQWLTSPEVSLDRVMLPYGLRDPYRRSHIESPAYRALWPGAPDYLDTLEKAAERASLDLGLPGAVDYEAAFRVAVTEIGQGGGVEPAIQRMAARWDEITRAEGRGLQRRAFADWSRISSGPGT